MYSLFTKGLLQIYSYTHLVFTVVNIDKETNCKSRYKSVIESNTTLHKGTFKVFKLVVPNFLHGFVSK